MSIEEKLLTVAAGLEEINEGINLEAELINELQSIVDNMPTDSNGSYEEGKQAGEDAMWDYTQDYGNRTDYRYAFFYWADAGYLDPKYPLNVTNGECILNVYKGKSVNWSKFNFANSTTLYSAFAHSGLTRIDADVCVTGTNASGLINTFAGCSGLQHIQKVTAFPTVNWSNTFLNCTALTHVIFDGTVATNGLNLQWSTKLDKESIESVIDALSDTTSGLSITLSMAAVDSAFYDPDEEDVIGSTSSAWAWLCDSKSNWTINLV